jgi:hypothetical protein
MKLLERQDTYGDGEESRSEDSERMKEEASLQKGLSSSPVVHVGNTITILSGNSNGMIKALTMEPAFKIRSGMESWRE